MNIAVDAMGGDHAPSVVVEGAVRAVESASGDIAVVLFGPEDRVHAEMDDQGVDASLPIRVVDAPDIVEMGESPSSAVKNKRNSSIHRGLGALKEGQVDAFASAGNTGAVMAASMFILGRIHNVERPAIVGFFPTTEGASVVIDIGTNVDCKPEHLRQFAKMATVYSRTILKWDNPSVGLVNIGEEPGKGNEQVKATYELLQQADGINFRGNIEGGDLLHHAADIILCDGFVGNTLLKFGESMTTVLSEMTQQEMQRQNLSPDEQKLVARVLGNVRKGFDAEERGGAPLLGVNGHVFIGHGRSSARAISQMIQSAAEAAREDVVSQIVSVFATSASAH